jgi:hypothetical protein
MKHEIKKDQTNGGSRARVNRQKQTVRLQRLIELLPANTRLHDTIKILQFNVAKTPKSQCCDSEKVSNNQ